MSAGMKPLLTKVAAGEALNRAEAREAFSILMSGEATPSQIGGFLMALRVRGEVVDEIAGAVDVMRANMLPVEAPGDAIDIVGTGGDQAGTYNVSTCAAFVVAGCGLTVAKHGNRALSSRSGSADVLAALGVNVDLSPDQIGEVISTAGLGFMFAPTHHAAMRFVGPSRVELGTRTIFNLLGPLANPAGVKRLLLGVYSREWVRPLAEALNALGAEKAWVVHGEGLDEMTVCGRTHVASLEHGSIREWELTPEEAGLALHPTSDLIGGDAAHNAEALRRVLANEPSAYRDIVLLNAAGALIVADKASSLDQGVALAKASLAEGRAAEALARLVTTSQDLGRRPS
ncbi:anthranilate phosphoribosyltransferase [Aureimonas ureilytica]|uniref:Anthranilate phosphoribosyltransferase n=1 Tax=Aureimonas ureilytica TaxID=401562 RepID=A0A175R6E1_9HYPH|nr:anthranilate phosphoribosyltransferase [Aureimonas ureilytica]KTQ95054.1 anthranilate phosphoribosyltransferase [Aureimonas ureilytica]